MPQPRPQAAHTPVDTLTDESKVHIVCTGIVGAGKTSLIKTLLGIEPNEQSDRNRALVVGMGNGPRQPVEVDIGECPNPIRRVAVDARHAVTQSLSALTQSDASLVMHDMPGELAVGAAATGHVWRRYYDVGIFVAMGSANEAQKAIFDRVRVCAAALRCKGWRTSL